MNFDATTRILVSNTVVYTSKSQLHALSSYLLFGSSNKENNWGRLITHDKLNLSASLSTARFLWLLRLTIIRA